MRKKTVETCEMCSAEVRNPTTIKVEGALLRVCPNCTSFGNIVEDKKKRRKSVRSSTKSKTKKKSKQKKSRRKSRNKDEDERILIMDYGREIRKARSKKKLTQEQLSSKTGISVPYIRSIEAEKMRPTDQVARKLEQELDIELFEETETELEYQEKSSGEDLTVGDIVNIKRLEFD